ncbi:MAG: hypothetical protein FJ290_01905 [Planctomycetes bacterium]|nr:hypothetical protein [Planctomycetota bacterium]
MAKRREDIDWYVDMSERLERREQRRKWVILGFCVAVPLIAMGLFVLYIVLDKAGVFAQLRGRREKDPIEKAVAARKSLPLEPVQVASLQKGDMRFPQLDNEGLITSMNHYFREERLKNADTFTVNRESEEEGSIAAYRLRNIGTGEVYEFSNIRVKRIQAEWTITEGGWNQIRDELRAKMNVRLGPPML